MSRLRILVCYTDELKYCIYRCIGCAHKHKLVPWGVSFITLAIRDALIIKGWKLLGRYETCRSLTASLLKRFIDTSSTVILHLIIQFHHLILFYFFHPINFLFVRFSVSLFLSWFITLVIIFTLNYFSKSLLSL